MSTHNPNTEEATSAQSSLDGYWYQLKVSVLFALDLMANKQQTDQITLEPASEEDLETELTSEPGALTQGLTFKTRKLIVQCKLRNTGPWTIDGVKSLLAHGKQRTPAKDLLKNADVNYLLVTSADLSGVARNLAVKSPTQWHRLKPMPPTLSKALPNGSDGRVAVWSSLDQEKVEHRIKDSLVDRFRVPHSRVHACIEKLEEAALVRMKGTQAGVWTRKDVIDIIEAHGGYDGVSKDLNQFVPPTNWDDLLVQLRERNAIVLTGPSGTGKTTTAKALIATLREENSGLTHVKIEGGPERLRDDKTVGSVIFEIEDPWGKYRAEPDSLPWNDAVNEFLASASPDRMFVVTSRSDVMQAAHLKTLDQRFKAQLLAGHYRTLERSELFDLRLRGLPRAEQASALKYKSQTIKDLTLPLELDRFFGAAGLGPRQGENEATFMHRCIDDARKRSIESALILVIEGQEIWEGAAVLWALLKTKNRLTFGVLEDLEYDICQVIPKLEDRLSGLASFLIAGGNLRQDKTEFSCAHPRVEAGLEQAMLIKRAAASRTLSSLLDALVGLDDHNQTDWGAETATQTVATLSSITDLKVRVSTSTQKRIDDWLTERLASLESTFGDDLTLAVKAGSEGCAVAELARWLDESPINNQWFNMTSWKEPKKSKAWYEWLSDSPHTHAICDAFITRVVAFRNRSFQGKFHEAIKKLSPNLTPSFQAALSKILKHDYNPNAETLIDGAIVDLDEFATVFAKAAEYSEQPQQDLDRESLLALHNQNYDDEAQDHYWESMGEEGHTAREILRAYIEARRHRGEWHSLANHSNRNGFIWEWIRAIQKNAKPPTQEELIFLGQASQNSSYEGNFWNLVEKHYDPVIFDILEARLRQGSEQDETRTHAASVALRHAPHLIETLFSSGSDLTNQRLLELALDVQSCLDDETSDETGPKLDLAALTASAEGTVKEAISLLLGSDEPNVSKLDTLMLSTVPINAQISLNLSVSQTLSKYGVDVAERLKNILSTKHEVTAESIELATQAMQLAATSHNKSLVKLGLKHEFARVRIEAMNAVFDVSSGPLPAEILKNQGDASSLVRRRLIEMLKARSDAAHIPTLIKLSYDTWTPDYHRQDALVSYPIAEDAIKILREQPSLTDDVYRELIESFSNSKSYYVRLQLLRTMVRHGSSDRQKKLIEMAIGEGRPTVQEMTSRALLIEADSFNNDHLALIDDDKIASVSPAVCLSLCMLISKIAPDDRLLQTTKSLAANSNRRVFVALVFLTIPPHRTEAMHNAIANFLPDDVVACLEKMVETGTSEDLSCLDRLGDVQSVERIKTSLRIWYKKEQKTKKRKAKAD